MERAAEAVELRASMLQFALRASVCVCVCVCVCVSALNIHAMRTQAASRHPRSCT